MTWGRRNHETRTGVNWCYAEMQENLKNGYEDYRDNAMQQTNNERVYIAPVGLAFKAIHDTYCIDGVSTAECTGKNSGVSVGCVPATDGTTKFTK